MKKRFFIVPVALLAVGAGGYFGWQYLMEENAESENAVYVTAISSLSQTAAGTQNRYAGVVEPQDTVEVKLESGRQVSEVKVKEGQEVKAGDVLFEYDLSSIQDDLTEAELEYDQLINEANGIMDQINTYMKEQRSASQDQQLSYTIQIETAKMSLKKNEYNQKSKAAEIEKLKSSMNQTAVTSQIDGVIKKIDTSQMGTEESSDQDSYFSGNSGSDSNAFITILSTGAYRVKGKVNEQNYQSIAPGLPVIIRSRVDESQTWSGTMGTIDTESSNDNQNNMYYYGMSSDSQTTSSSYNFYVELDTSEDLMLGQHVYIEMDEGQQEEREGLWLNDYYIVDIAGEPYVWGSTENSNKLEKLPVVVGDYDENLGKYEILEGLSEEDYIAFPSGAMEEGLPVLVTDDLQLMMESSLQMDIDQEGDALPIDSEDEDTENQESLSDEEVNPLDGTEIIDQEGEQGINNMDAGSDIDIPDDISQNVQVIDEWSDEMPMEDAASESGMTMDEDLTPVNELSDEDMQMMDEAFPVEGEEMG
ncbi:MAG: efflux RND transporter periplasmic adaptor subunit [Eubacteriales bacterium]|nr:efflux RND transporter periplasmic adaptor subunit [Eubacteriales bacterium]